MIDSGVDLDDALSNGSIMGLRALLLIIILTGLPLILVSNSLQVALLYVYDLIYEPSGIINAGLLSRLLLEMLLFCIHSPL